MTHFALSRSKAFLFAGLFVFTTLLTACVPNPVYTLCQQLGGQSFSPHYSSSLLSNFESQAYCVLADDNYCRLMFIGPSRSEPACIPVMVGWRPLAADTAATLTTALTQHFTQTQPLAVSIMDKDDTVGKSTVLEFASPSSLGTRMADVTAVLTQTLKQIGWQAQALPDAAMWVDGEQTRDHVQFTNGANLCQSMLAWISPTDYVNCSEVSTIRDCVANNPDTHIFTLYLSCAEAINAPTP